MGMRVLPPLTGPFAAPPFASGLSPLPATINLVRSQVQALLLSSPSFHSIPSDEKRRLAHNMVKIASYAAELIRDDWYQSEKLGQRPVVRYRRTLEPVRTVKQLAPNLAMARAAADDSRPTKASQIGRVTQETLRAIAFPTFVADLINSTFNAIINASMRQMESFSRLVEDMSKTVDQFMNDNVTDNAARDWLADRYPTYLQVKADDPKSSPQLVLREGAENQSPPSWQQDLNLSEEVGLDEDSIEEILVPAARRKLAQNRMQMLSTLILMGMNRIIVTAGKIRATMQFHIDTTDRDQEQRATDFDARMGASGQFGMGWWSASASMSVAYVSSVRSQSDSEMNVEANVTGEVELQFKTDYFPLNRFATGGTISRIQGNTVNPEENTPNHEFSKLEPLTRRKDRERSNLPPPPPLRTAASPVLKPEAPEPVTPVKPPPNPADSEKSAEEKPKEEQVDQATDDKNKAENTEQGKQAAVSDKADSKPKETAESKDRQSANENTTGEKTASTVENDSTVTPSGSDTTGQDGQS